MLKSAKNHQKLVPVLGFGWKLIRKGKELLKKGFFPAFLKRLLLCCC